MLPADAARPRETASLLVPTMRRAIYIGMLALIWALGMFLIINWLDRFLDGDGRLRITLVIGGWLAGTMSVALAEEVASLGGSAAGSRKDVVYLLNNRLQAMQARPVMAIDP
jgi:hypothetical protein